MSKKYLYYKIIGGGLLNYPEITDMTDMQIIDLYKNNKLPYPLIKYFTSPKTIRRRFENLKNFKYKLIEREYSISYIDLPKKYYQFKNDDGSYKYTILLFSHKNYLTYDLISDYFQEVNRIKCKRENERNGSPYDYFKNIDKFKQALRKTRELYKKITPFSLRMGLFSSVSECSSFRPTIIVSFIKMFKSRRILDISAGWGDRLIGCMAADVDYYFATDPNPNLHKKYDEMIHFFGKDKNKFVIKKDPFEKVDIQFYQNKKFDLVLTSPPYFDYEIYVDDEKQSVYKNRNINSWLNNFMYPSIEKAWNALERTGILALNINNKNKNPEEDYVGKIIKYVNRFIDSEFRGCISYAELYKDGQLRNPQPVWIWIKN